MKEPLKSDKLEHMQMQKLNNSGGNGEHSTVAKEQQQKLYKTGHMEVIPKSGEQQSVLLPSASA